MTRAMFLPVMRCAKRHCQAAYVASPDLRQLCPKCEAVRAKLVDVALGKRASKRDMTEHKRLSLRKRLGLPA